MKFRSIFAAVAVLAMATSVQAAKIVVTQVQTTTDNAFIPVGTQLVTFGVQVTAADLVNAGTNPVIFVQNVAFLGNGVNAGPIQGATSKVGSGNASDVQGIQTTYIDNMLVYPPTNAQLPTVGNGLGDEQFYGDSWWYNGSSSLAGSVKGTLFGYNDLAGTTQGIVTTSPNTTLGGGPNGTSGTSAVGTTGYLFNQQSTGIVGGGTSFSNMGFTGLFGPTGANSLTALPLSGKFVAGVLTVPLAQILTTGNILIAGDTTHSGFDYTMPGGVPTPGPVGPVGSGTFLLVAGTGVTSGPTGNGTYNWNGGTPLNDPSAGAGGGWHYDFAAKAIIGVPEPGTLALAGIGALGLLLAWRRRK